MFIIPRTNLWGKSKCSPCRVSVNSENWWKWVKMGENEWKWMKMGENGWKWMKMGENEWKWVKMGENGWKWVKMGENGWKWVKMGENWVKIGWKLVKIENFIFMNFWWFFAILGDFRQFWFISCHSLKVSCHFLKETGNLLKEQTVWSCCRNWLFFLYY